LYQIKHSYILILLKFEAYISDINITQSEMPLIVMPSKCVFSKKKRKKKLNTKGILIGNIIRTVSVNYLINT